MPIPHHACQDHPAYLSEISRVSAGELLYEFTVDDPVFYSQSWKGEITYWNDGARIYEYACHEGNYAMQGILQGARVFETQGRKLDQANVE